MVVVTVGNATQGFARLLSAVDRLAAMGVFGAERVIMQTGNTSEVSIQHCEQRAFLPMDEFLRLVEQADLVIAHAGAGTLLNVLRAGKVPVVMPRRKRYGEHVDDHQMELVEALGSTGWVIPALEPRDLPSAIAEARCRPRTVPGRGRSQMLSLIGVAIQQLLDNRK